MSLLAHTSRLVVFVGNYDEYIIVCESITFVFIYSQSL